MSPRSFVPASCRAIAAAVAVAIATAAPAASAAPDPVTSDERAAVVGRMGEQLVERYVFEDVGRACRDALDAALADGSLDGITAGEALAARLTEIVQSVSHDKHMRVRFRPPSADASDAGPAEPRNPIIDVIHRREREARSNFGFAALERLDGNIGYLDMRHFSGAPEARATAESAMRFLAHVDALVFDMRRNGGGDPDMVRFVCSYLFDEPTHLNSLYFRPTDETTEFWTIPVPGPSFADTPVFVLTSDFTFSGAEEFSYNLRTRERATLVGETTGGGANPGGMVPAGERFGIFIPTGRAINPITGTNWEGVGVKPHVAVDADDALERALELARAAIDARAKSDDVAREACFEAIRAATAAVEAADGEASGARIATALGTALDLGLLGELDVNIFGYRLIQLERPTCAVAVFALNAERFPESANVHDSLGEGLAALGRTKEAIAAYERSLELDPRNEHGREMLRRLRGEGG